MESNSNEKSSPSAIGNETGEGAPNFTTRPIPRKGQRRNLGRQARKRRKKYLEIEAAASDFVAAAAASVAWSKKKNSIGVSALSETKIDRSVEDKKHVSDDKLRNYTILPTDRSYVLCDVQGRTLLSESDRRDLIRQLGYLPGNALEVVARVEDAFSIEDLQRLFAAAVVVTRMKQEASVATSMIPSDCTLTADKVGSSLSNNKNNDSFDDVHSDENFRGNTNETVTGMMTTSMIQIVMKEPLVVKLYPLVLRDESSSTKRRRKRRRDQNEFFSESSGTDGDVIRNEKLETVSGEDQSSSSSPSAQKVALPLMEPFPTIYWVTHPFIKALISKLELDKMNVQFEQHLLAHDGTKGHQKSDDEGILRDPLVSMERAHNSYGRERRELLSEGDMEYVRRRRWCDDSQSSSNYCSNDRNSNKKNIASTTPFGDGCGVAGIRNPKAVKCLHAHAAHYWSGNRDNVVGYWVEQELKKRRP